MPAVLAMFSSRMDPLPSRRAKTEVCDRVAEDNGHNQAKEHGAEGEFAHLDVLGHEGPMGNRGLFLFLGWGHQLSFRRSAISFQLLQEWADG